MLSSGPVPPSVGGFPEWEGVRGTPALSWLLFQVGKAGRAPRDPQALQSQPAMGGNRCARGVQAALLPTRSR